MTKRQSTKEQTTINKAYT